MKISERTAGRNLGIDILRGLSILAVLLLHLNIHFGYSDTFLKEVLPKKLFSLLFWSGFYGVVVFFTLSGYLITSSILKKWGSLPNIDIWKFYWLRFSRIIPLLCLLILILSTLHLSGVDGFVIDSERTTLGRAIFAALTFHINWLEIKVGYLPANWDILWSISIEECFYLVFPIVCLFVRKKWQLVSILLIFLVVSPWARTELFVGNELGDRNHLAFIDSIALGCTTAILVTGRKFSRMMNLAFLWLGWSMVILIFVFRSFVYESGIVLFGLNITILSVGVSLILFWMHYYHSYVNKRKLAVFGWLSRLGLYSYEIYLTHMFVILFGVDIYEYLELGASWLVPYSILLLLLSYFLGRAVFTFFSEPLNLWLRSHVNLKTGTAPSLDKKL
ncbi:acyltransferase [Maribacter sp.]|nr:acyltransferase [Maribacter sp.]